MSRIVLAAAMPLAWLLGVGIQLTQAALYRPSAYGLACAGGFVLWWLARRGTRWRQWLAPAGLVCLGFGIAGWHATERSAQRLPASLEAGDLSVVGRVDGLAQRAPGGWRFVLEVEEASHAGRPVEVPRRIQLTWYMGSFTVDRASVSALPRQAPPLEPGQRWRFTVRLKQPHGASNPHGFDAELWWFQQGIGAIGHVRAKKGEFEPRLLDADAATPVDRWRQRVREAILADVPHERSAGVIAALVLGDQSAIDQDDWEVFRITAVAHLVAISGLHLTMFAWVASAAASALWRRCGAAPLACPAPVVGRWAGVGCSAAYAVFAGWGVPAQRTVWMLLTVALLQQSGRRWPWPLVLLAAACVVTLFDPWALLQPGFWLSFGAVGLLLAAESDARADGAARRPAVLGGGARVEGALRLAMGHLRSFLRTQAVATIGLAPLGLLFFHQISLVGFVANLVAVPLITLLVTPLALLGCLVPGGWWAASALLQGLGTWLTGLAGFEHARWFAAAAPAWAVGLGLAAGALAVMRVPRSAKLLAVPLALPMLLPPQPRPAAGEFELWALDVGQGTAVVVRTARHTLLYDTGPAYSGESDAGERVVVPVLRAWGERRLDRVVVSHRDIDHAGGASSVLAAYPSAEVWSSLEDEHPLLDAVRHHRRCEDGSAWEWDGVRFEVLHPGPAQRAPPLKPNQVSCVVRIRGARHSALLAGDIERHEEARLVALHGARLRADWLLAPHHGSKTSSTADFLAAVQPRVAVFQAGYRNRFGHPAAEVLARYRERGVEVVTSPVCGAYRWSSGQGQCERERRPRYWHHRPAGP